MLKRFRAREIVLCLAGFMMLLILAPALPPDALARGVITEGPARTDSGPAVLASVLTSGSSSGTTAEDTSLSAPAVVGQPGELVHVPVTLKSVGNVTGLQFDLGFSDSLLTYDSWSGGGIALPDHMVAANLYAAGKVRVVIASLSNANIPAGEGSVIILSFHAKTTALQGQNCQLALSNTSFCDSDSKSLSGSVSNGQFHIPGQSITAPAVQTVDAGAVAVNSATLNGSIDFNGGASITEYGFYWGAASSTPQKLVLGASNHSGAFSGSLNGLSPETAYSFKAYATNSAGTSYGDVKNFTTLSGGGIADTTTTNPTTTFKPELVPATSVKQDCMFTDLTEKHWAFQVVTDLCNQGIISGYPDGTFKPDSSITRAEYAGIITRAQGLADERRAAPSFPDVAPGNWYYGYVEAVAAAGLVKGFETGEFHPNELITREQMVSILIRAVKKESIANGADERTAFTDDSSISGWARGNIVAAVQGGLAGYPDNTFRPGNSATRAEACAMLARFF